MPDTTTLQESHATHALRPANALVLATLGAIAVVMGLWSLWSLEWLPTNIAFNCIVIIPLTLVAGYDIQLVRFHKLLQLPPLTPKGRIKGWLYWGIVALVILQIIWKQKGFVAGLLGVVFLVEAMCAFIHFLSARLDRKLALLSVAQSLLHAMGWLLFLGMTIYGIDRYIGILEEDVNFVGEFPPALQDIFQWCVNTPGVALTGHLALFLVGASLALRLYLYSIQAKVPYKSILNPLGKTAIACFIVALLLQGYAMARLHACMKDALHLWDGTYELADGDHEDAFLNAQKDLGKTLVSLVHQETDEEAPYAWGRFAQMKDDDRLQPWYPPELGIDEEDTEKLAKYLDQLAPSLQELDALLQMMETIKVARVANGTWLLAEWRFRTYVELKRWDDAQNSLADLARIARHQTAAYDMEERLQGLHRIVLWDELQKKLPEKCHTAVASQATALKEFLGSLRHQPAIASITREIHERLQLVQKEFQGWGIPMSNLYMLATIDDIRLLQSFRNIETPAQAAIIPKEKFTLLLYCSFARNCIAQVYNYEWESALGRMEQYE